MFVTLERTGKLPQYIIPFGSGTGITFYAVIIIFGALCALLFSSYRAYKDGFDKTFFINVFFVAFPCGIIGARIWYVIASWQTEFKGEPFYKVFEIWNGGLAIQGGALFGILAGVIFVLIRRKGTNVLQAVDWAVPTILFAQAIGRFGNFFNAEVHGNIVSTSAYSSLPSFIINQMGYSSSTSSVLAENEMYVPLFLIEALLNLCGYFILTHGVESFFKKCRLFGDEGFLYLTWYGVIRAILEPLRNGTYNMSSGGTMRAVSMAIAFICLGVIGIFLNHLLVRIQLNREQVLFKPIHNLILNKSNTLVPKDYGYAKKSSVKFKL